MGLLGRHDPLHHRKRRCPAVLQRRPRQVHKTCDAPLPIPPKPLVAGLARDPVARAQTAHRLFVLKAGRDKPDPLIHRTSLSPCHPRSSRRQENCYLSIRSRLLPIYPGRTPSPTLPRAAGRGEPAKVLGLDPRMGGGSRAPVPVDPRPDPSRPAAEPPSPQGGGMGTRFGSAPPGRPAPHLQPPDRRRLGRRKSVFARRARGPGNSTLPLSRSRGPPAATPYAASPATRSPRPPLPPHPPAPLMPPLPHIRPPNHRRLPRCKSVPFASGRAQEYLPRGKRYPRRLHPL